MGEWEAKRTQDSKELSARRASPSLWRLISRTNSSSTDTCAQQRGRNRLGDRGESSRRRERVSTRGRSNRWREAGVETRDSAKAAPISNGETNRTGTMEKEGFSVVAPIITSLPDSTYGRKTSCCVRLKRWISSRKRIVGVLLLEKTLSHSSSTERTSLRSLVQQESDLKGQVVCFEMIYATVVLPQPGGPQRMNEGGGSFSKRVRTTEPSANISALPYDSL